MSGLLQFDRRTVRWMSLSQGPTVSRRSLRQTVRRGLCASLNAGAHAGHHQRRRADHQPMRVDVSSRREPIDLRAGVRRSMTSTAARWNRLGLSVDAPAGGRPVSRLAASSRTWRSSLDEAAVITRCAAASRQGEQDAVAAALRAASAAHPDRGACDHRRRRRRAARTDGARRPVGPAPNQAAVESLRTSLGPLG